MNVTSKEPLAVLDCVCRLEGAIAVLKLIEDNLWNQMGEGGLMEELNDPHYALQCAATIFRAVRDDLSNYPNGFKVEEPRP